jgi:hypothetical protein
MTPSSLVLLSVLIVEKKSDYLYQNVQISPALHLRREPLTLTTSGTIKLVGDVLVAQRRFHQPKATARAVRQANRLTIPSTLSVANIGHSSPDETPVRDALMKKLAGLVASGPNKTSGVDRQVRHIGNYVVNSTSIRATQKATLQDVAAAVSEMQMPFVSSPLYVMQKFVSQKVIAFRLLQSLHDNIYTANISDINPLSPGHFLIVMHPRSKEVVVGEGKPKSDRY